MNSILLIIPAHNEGENIEKVIEGIRNLKIEYLDILVVNDGSKDNTEEILKKINIKCISHPYNLGYGAALQTGFKYAVTKGYDYVIQFDGDGQHDPQNIVNIINELEKNDYDIVIGSRFIGGKLKQISTLKKIAINFFVFMIKIFTGYRIYDPTSGLKGLNYRTYKYYSTMGNYPGDYPDADILIQMLKCKYRIKEIDAIMYYRENGVSMHSGLKPMYYFIKVLLSIFIVILRLRFDRKESCRDEFSI
jgi:glycosyltransferase involved in cell wall biosynthesis